MLSLVTMTQVLLLAIINSTTMFENIPFYASKVFPMKLLSEKILSDITCACSFIVLLVPICKSTVNQCLLNTCLRQSYLPSMVASEKLRTSTFLPSYDIRFFVNSREYKSLTISVYSFSIYLRGFPGPFYLYLFFYLFIAFIFSIGC